MLSGLVANEGPGGETGGGTPLFGNQAMRNVQWARESSEGVRGRGRDGSRIGRVCGVTGGGGLQDGAMGKRRVRDGQGNGHMVRGPRRDKKRARWGREGH